MILLLPGLGALAASTGEHAAMQRLSLLLRGWPKISILHALRYIAVAIRIGYASCRHRTTARAANDRQFDRRTRPGWHTRRRPCWASPFLIEGSPGTGKTNIATHDLSDGQRTTGCPRTA